MAAALSDLPIVGGVFDAIGTYFADTALILRNPTRFLARLGESRHDELPRALRFYFAGFGIAYLVQIPWLVHYDAEMSQAIALIYTCLHVALLLVTLHLILMAIRGARSPRRSLVAYLYPVGLFLRDRPDIG